MPCELMLEAQFFESDRVPQMSLFTGRIEGITRYKMTFGLQTDWHFSWQGLFKPTTLTVQFPTAPGEINVWQLQQLVSLVVGAAGAIGIAALLVFAGNMVAWKFGWAILSLSVLLCMAMVYFGQHYASREIVRIQLVNREGLLRLVLPDRLKAVRTVYHHAHEQWIAAGRPMPVSPDEDDDFADAVKPGWDQATPGT